MTAEDEEINEEEEEGKPGGSALGPRGVDGEAGIPLSPREVEEEGRIGAKGGRGVLRRLLEGTWLSWRAPGHSLPRGEEVEGWTEGGWGFLPPDVLEAVVAAVPPRQLPRARLACRSWSKAAAAGTVPPIAPLSLDPLRLVRLPSLFPFAREIDLAARCACPLPSPPEASAALLSPLLLLPPLLRISFPPGSPLGPSLLRLVKAAMSYRGNEKEADKETRIINARACCWAGGGDCLIAEEVSGG